MFEKTLSKGKMSFEDFLNMLEENKDKTAKVKIKKTGIIFEKKTVDSKNSLESILPLIKEEFSPNEKYVPMIEYRIKEERNGTKSYNFTVKYLTREGVILYDKKIGEGIELRNLEKIGKICYQEN
ncbi:MAG: hypothetical protein J7L45_02760 [Candidatus Aenigmarchaeota archaeon]|nr:hypothetical protein [Candidatus Aenigmarchaeota archaeon]